MPYAYDRYSNLFLNAYINRHAHTVYLKMIEVYSPLGIWHIFTSVLPAVWTQSDHVAIGCLCVCLCVSAEILTFCMLHVFLHAF